MHKETFGLLFFLPILYIYIYIGPSFIYREPTFPPGHRPRCKAEKLSRVRRYLHFATHKKVYSRFNEFRAVLPEILSALASAAERGRIAVIMARITLSSPRFVSFFFCFVFNNTGQSKIISILILCEKNTIYFTYTLE